MRLRVAREVQIVNPGDLDQCRALFVERAVRPVRGTREVPRHLPAVHGVVAGRVDQERPRIWTSRTGTTAQLMSTLAKKLLKTAALVDLARRPTDELRGSKRLWAAAIVLIDSLGAVPITYFAYGRKRT